MVYIFNSWLRTALAIVLLDLVLLQLPSICASRWDLSLDELSFVGGRRILQKAVDEGNGRIGNDKYEGKSLLTPKILAMGMPAVLVLCCSFLCACFRTRRRDIDQSVIVKDLNSTDSVSSVERHSVFEKVPGSPLKIPPSPSRFSMSPQLNRVGSVHLTMTQITKATQNFSRSLVIGEGGFGTVYKAQLENGLVVSIKRAKKEHLETLRNEFRSEVELLSKIDHRSLVKLLGFVDTENERLIITEFVSNGTLRDHLDGHQGNYLDFNQRLEIAIDVAHGLTYLHLYSEKQIIHRDVKSSNILLTERMRAKVADFGFAKLGDVDSGKTHIYTQVKGTVGYLDPQYMKTNELTPKSDVYSFGILLLEILTGRRPVERNKPADQKITIRWAFKNYNEGNLMEMVDPQMREDMVDRGILMQMFGLAIQCAAPTRVDRPDMKSVGEQLWEIRTDYRKSGRRR